MGTRTTDHTTETINCDTCGGVYRHDCDYRQGRCPHHPPLIEISVTRKLLYLCLAPFIITAWAVANPSKMWQQAKKDWNIK
jgi:hypothetical protein